MGGGGRGRGGQKEEEIRRTRRSRRVRLINFLEQCKKKSVLTKTRRTPTIVVSAALMYTCRCKGASLAQHTHKTMFTACFISNICTKPQARSLPVDAMLNRGH